MRLIRDEGAYRRVLADFLACRTSADMFILRFFHLWRCDGAPVEDDGGATPASVSSPGFYGLMDTINSLCEEYSCTLADGCGYRVSEEQFRKEVGSLVEERPGPPRA
jgi:hypothetical protein